MINFDHGIAAKSLARLSHKTPEEIFRIFFNSDITQRFEKGKISPRDFFLQVKKLLGLKIGYEQFLPIWNEIFFLTKDTRRVYNLAKDLSHKYKLAVLSNVNILHMDFILKNFPIFEPYQYIFASYELGLRKPSPLIYRKVLKILNVLPSETFYTDDRAELIEKAGKLGIQAFVYKTPRQLAGDLSCCGVSVAAKAI